MTFAMLIVASSPLMPWAFTAIAFGPGADAVTFRAAEEASPVEARRYTAEELVPVCEQRLLVIVAPRRKHAVPPLETPLTITLSTVPAYMESVWPVLAEVLSI